MGVIWVAILIMATGAAAAPAAVKYDQRQEGDVNVRADLENFVILIIPTSSNNNLGLLDFLSKAIPSRNQLKNKQRFESKKPLAPIISAEEDLSTQHFIESKTAPYHVDISRTRSHLAKLHPQMKAPATNSDEVLIAHSPVVALKNKPDSPERQERNIIIQNDDNVQALILTSDIAVGVKKQENKNEKSEMNEPGGDLLLLGSEFVQCGPDQKRDSQGICQLIVKS